MASAPKPKLEGEDPAAEDDELLSALAPHDYVDDEEAEYVIVDCLGGGAHRYHAQVILKRFAKERWKLIREG